MNEKPPRFGSKRFRQILWSAFAGDALAAVKGLYWFLTRRRVRGWARLAVAAADAPNNYHRWTTTGEAHAFGAFRLAHPQQRRLSIVPLLIGVEARDGGAAARTIRSARLVFGEHVRIHAPPNDQRLADVLDSLDEASAEWLLPLVAGDCVSSALADILQRVVRDPAGAALIYWDEDTVGGEGRHDPWIKPKWDEILFGRVGGLAGASSMSLSAARSLARAMPDRWDRAGVERLAMALASDDARPEPAHVPLILTHRTQRNALKRDLDPAPRLTLAGDWPTVSILVPTRDRPELLDACMRGVERTSYPGEVELVLIDNGTKDAAALRIIDQAASGRGAKVLRDDGPFNFSRLNNAGARTAAGEFLCFLNNDVEPLDEHWLMNMISYARDEGVGAVGAMLLYPSGRIQHAGVAIGVGGAAGHIQKGVDPADTRFRTWHQVTRRVSAVTAAAMAVRKEAFFNVGGFDEAAFPVAFNDIDLCLRLDEAGLRNIYVAEARLVHRESESRGDDRSRGHAQRFANELAQLQQRWHTRDFVDPFHSPLFSRFVERCVLAL
ncbi:MAG: glycosyltransferase [Sphingomicrobium sp.]